MSNNADKLRQRLEIRKYLVFAGMFLLFLGAIWFIFAPSEEDRRKEEKNAGFNTELPDPRGAGIEGDKIAAYEQADMKRKQAEKMRTLGDFSGISDENSGTRVQLSPDADDKESSLHETGRREEARYSSVSAYNDINRTLGNFYESPQEDLEKEALKAEVEQLKQAAAAQNAQPGYEEQVALLEKSYELAAKYMPGNGGKNKENHPDDGARLNILDELCLPLVKKNGYFLSLKGRQAPEEVKEAKKGIQLLGGQIESTHDFTLANHDDFRSNIIIKKVKETPKKYPRMFSKIKKSPL